MNRNFRIEVRLHRARSKVKLWDFIAIQIACFNSYSRGTKKSWSMKIFIAKTEWSNDMTIGNWLKSRCHFRTDNITDSSLNFVENYKIYIRSTNSFMEAILKARMDLLNIESLFDGDVITSTSQWNEILDLAFDPNIKKLRDAINQIWFPKSTCQNGILPAIIKFGQYHLVRKKMLSLSFRSCIYCNFIFKKIGLQRIFLIIPKEFPFLSYTHYSHTE